MDYRIQRLKEDLTLAQQRNKKQKRANANLKLAYDNKCNENHILKQSLYEIREIVKNCSDNLDDIMCYDIDKYKKLDILQIIDKVLGGSDNQ